MSPMTARRVVVATPRSMPENCWALRTLLSGSTIRQ
jgi:hypothetical protein